MFSVHAQLYTSNLILGYIPLAQWMMVSCRPFSKRTNAFLEKNQSIKTQCPVWRSLSSVGVVQPGHPKWSDPGMFAIATHMKFCRARTILDLGVVSGHLMGHARHCPHWLRVHPRQPGGKTPSPHGPKMQVQLKCRTVHPFGMISSVD